MRILESWLLAYVLNSLWQVPLIFAAAFAATRLARFAGPRVEHRIWVVALAFEAILPACSFRLGDLGSALWRMFLHNWGHKGIDGQARVLIGPGVIDGTGLRLPPPLLAPFVAAYLVIVLYFAGRLLWGITRTSRMQRLAQPLPLATDAAESWQRMHRVFGQGSTLSSERAPIAASAMISGPVTVGVRRRVLLMPAGFLDALSPADRDALLAHELAHIARHDFAKNLLYGALSLPVAYHPLLWLTRSSIAESREQVCDAMAAQAVAGRESYARSLLRLAAMLSDPAPARILHAIGIFDAHNFERRIMNLTRKHVEVRGVRRLALVAACGVIALAACASALALRMDVDSPKGENGRPIRVHVKAEIMQNEILKKVPPVYPAQAKESGDTLDGPVLLAVVIGKDGKPENIRVSKSLRGDYDQSALDAVRQWQWKPYLLNGEPIEVDTTVTVIYSMEK